MALEFSKKLYSFFKQITNNLYVETQENEDIVSKNTEDIHRTELETESKISNLDNDSTSIKPSDLELSKAEMFDEVDLPVIDKLRLDYGRIIFEKALKRYPMAVSHTLNTLHWSSSDRLWYRLT